MEDADEDSVSGQPIVSQHLDRLSVDVVPTLLVPVVVCRHQMPPSEQLDHIARRRRRTGFHDALVHHAQGRLGRLWRLWLGRPPPPLAAGRADPRPLGRRLFILVVREAPRLVLRVPEPAVRVVRIGLDAQHLAGGVWIAILE
eukprot:scaffold6959_cov146-Isochrysis_galbana.AAC.2